MANGLGGTMKYNKFKVSPADQRTWRGKTYASKAEMEYAKILDGEMRAGLWDEIIEQPHIRLGPIDYLPDFALLARGVWVWVDVKGAMTPEFKLKLKLWRAYGPGELRIVKKSGKNFKVAERVISTKGAA
jgi:predicted nuclease of restriction endonuclease-like RecB superfamily